MPFDVNGALEAGYSPAEIADHLGEQKKFDVAGARKEGYSDNEIIGHLAGLSASKKEESLGGAFLKGAEQLGSTARTAAESLYKSPEEAALAGQKRQENIAARHGENVGFGKVQKAFEQEGLFSAAGELAKQVPKAIAEQAPNLAATAAGAGAGFMLGGPFGAIAGAAVPSFIQQYGGNLEAQAQAQQEEGKPLDINRGVAAAAAVPQTALDVAQSFIPFGGKIAGKLFGPTVGKLLGAGEGAAAEKLAKESLLSTVAKGTATGIAAEVPPEIAQQALQRAQAGQSLLDQDAMNDYGSTAFAVALLGPLGILGRVSNKSEAGRKLAEAQQKASIENKPVDVPIDVAPPSTEDKTQAPLMLGYDPSIGQQVMTVFPDGRIAPSEQAAFDERYKIRSTIPTAEEEAQTKPLLPAEVAANTQPVAMIEPDGSIKTYEGVPNRTDSGVNFLDENKKIIKTIKPDNKSAIINPTEQDMFNLQTTALESRLPKMRNDLERARIDSNKADGAFKQFLKEHPLQSTYYRDLINPSHNPNKMLSDGQAKGIFTKGVKNGYALDDLARIATETGFMTEDELNDPSDVGGVNAMADKIAAVYHGESVPTAFSAEANARYQALDLEHQKLEDEIAKRKEQAKQFPTEEEEIAPEFTPEGEATPAAPEEFENQEPVNPSFRAEIKTPFADKFIADEKKLAKQLRAGLDRMGLKDVGLKLEDAVHEYVNGKMEEVNGAYFNKLIKLSLSGDNIFRTMSHEALHAMKDLGFFSDADWKILENKAKSEWMAKYDIAEKYSHEPMEVQLEEAIAFAFADHNKQLPLIKRIMNAAVEALKTIGNIFRANGYRKAEDIFKEAAAGKLKEAEINKTVKKPEIKKEPIGKPINTDSEAFKKWFRNSVFVKDGKPQILYHGTQADITKFKTGFGAFGEGIYLSPNPEKASSYARNTGKSWKPAGIEGGNVIPLFVRMENPKIKDVDVFNVKDANGKTMGLEKAAKYITDKAKEEGYDGIILRDPSSGEITEAIAFNPAQVKSAISNTGEFNIKNPDIRAEIPSKAKLKTALHGVDPEYAEKILKQFTQEPATVKEKFEGLKAGFYDRMITGIFDEFRAIKKYDPSAYMMARISKSIDGGLQGLLEYGQVFNDGGALNIKPGTKGLLDILKPVGQEVDQYQIWKALNRDANLPVEKRSFDPELVAGRNKLIAGDINGKSRKDIYETALKEENELNRSVLKVALDAGIIDQKGYDRFANDIYYIPFYKMMEDGDVGSISSSSRLTNQQFSKMLKGGPKKTNDLMENVLMNWSHILSAAMKNQAAIKTIDAADTMGVVELAEKQNGKFPPNTVKVMRDGQEVHYTISDPDLVDAISTISYLGPKSGFLNVAKGFTNILRYGITMSPAYKIRNLIRDSIQSAAISDLSSNMFGNIYNGLTMSKEGHPTFMAALAGGGIFEMGTAHEGNQAKLIKRLIDKGVSETSILDTPEKIKGKLQEALDYYNEIGNKFENANRLALYQKLIDQGKTHLEASYQARDLMDFSMQGQFRAIKIIGSVVPFFNARIQGLYKLGRDGIAPTYRVICNATTGKPLENESDKVKALKFSTISSAIMLASMALYGMYKDDEDFKRREDWDRDNYWWFKIGETQYRIPKPFEIGALGTIAERSYEQFADDTVEGKVFFQRLGSMLGNTFSMNPTPQMVKPLIDLYANTDSFTGAPIESAGMEKLSKQERKTNNTSGLAIALGGVSSAASKVLTMNSDAQGVSPIQIDYAIKAYFGWLGATAASTADLAVEPFQEGTKVHPPLIDSLAMGFIKTEPETRSKYMTNFYQNNANLQSALADMRHYAELGDSEKVQEIIAEKGNDIALAKMYDQTGKQLAMLRQQIRVIEANPNIPADEKRAEMIRLKILMSEMAERVESIRISIKK